MLSNKLQPSKLLTLQVDRSNKRVKSRESEHREFKLKFENKNIPKIARTMASYANRDGGVIFFGIKERPRELVGIENGEIPDDVVFTNFLREYFQPEILFESKTINIIGEQVHCLIIKPSLKKPVICKKTKSIRREQNRPDKEVLREGAIYYRYSASSNEIKYADLKIMLDNEKESLFKSMIENITLLNKVGIDKAAVVNAHELSGNNQAATIFLTNDTAENLNWIDSGKFVEDENEGGKAYYVVRQVEIKHGVEIPTPTDFSTTHPMTKTALSKEVKITGIDFDAVTWKLGIKDNPKYHISSHHGKNMIHKFTDEAKEIILDIYPLELERRREVIKIVTEEYKAALRT